MAGTRGLRGLFMLLGNSAGSEQLLGSKENEQR